MVLRSVLTARHDSPAAGGNNDFYCCDGAFDECCGCGMGLGMEFPLPQLAGLESCFAESCTPGAVAQPHAAVCTDSDQ